MKMMMMKKRMKMKNKGSPVMMCVEYVCVLSGNCFAKNVNSSAAQYQLQYKNCTDFCIADKILCRENTFIKKIAGCSFLRGYYIQLDFKASDVKCF